MRVLMIGLTPPLEGGSQRHICEISLRIKNSEVLTQKGSICANKVELPILKHPIFLRNILFFIMAAAYSLFLMITPKKKYDLVHIHENLLYFLVPLLHLRYKVIVTVHGIKGFKFYTNKFLWFFFKQGLKAADRIICVDLVEKNMLEKEGLKGVGHVSNGVDFSPYSKIKAKSKNKIAFVGRIHRQKGVEFMLKAFELVSKKYPDYKLEIIGKKEGELYEELSKKYTNKRIIWKGFILDRKKLFSEIASSEILVFPSIWEALPWPALLEGLASGRAVIASNLDGMEEVFDNGKNIVLVKPADVAGLENAMNKLIENRGLGAKIGRNGKALAKLYSWDRIAKGVEKEYEK